MKHTRTTFQGDRTYQTIDMTKSLANTHISFFQTTSFVELRDGSLKRRRRKKSYKDIYLERKDYCEVIVSSKSKKKIRYSTENNPKSLKLSPVHNSNRKMWKRQVKKEDDYLTIISDNETEKKLNDETSNMRVISNKEEILIKELEEHSKISPIKCKQISIDEKASTITDISKINRNINSELVNSNFYYIANMDLDKFLNKSNRKDITISNSINNQSKNSKKRFINFDDFINYEEDLNELEQLDQDMKMKENPKVELEEKSNNIKLMTINTNLQNRMAENDEQLTDGVESYEKNPTIVYVRKQTQSSKNFSIDKGSEVRESLNNIGEDKNDQEGLLTKQPSSSSKKYDFVEKLSNSNCSYQDTNSGKQTGIYHKKKYGRKEELPELPKNDQQSYDNNYLHEQQKHQKERLQKNEPRQHEDKLQSLQTTKHQIQPIQLYQSEIQSQQQQQSQQKQQYKFQPKKQNQNQQQFQSKKQVDEDLLKIQLSKQQYENNTMNQLEHITSMNSITSNKTDNVSHIASNPKPEEYGNNNNYNREEGNEHMPQSRFYSIDLYHPNQKNQQVINIIPINKIKINESHEKEKVMNSQIEPPSDNMIAYNITQQKKQQKIGNTPSSYVTSHQSATNINNETPNEFNNEDEAHKDIIHQSQKEYDILYNNPHYSQSPGIFNNENLLQSSINSPNSGEYNGKTFKHKALLLSMKGNQDNLGNETEELHPIDKLQSVNNSQKDLNTQKTQKTTYSNKSIHKTLLEKIKSETNEMINPTRKQRFKEDNQNKITTNRTTKGRSDLNLKRSNEHQSGKKNISIILEENEQANIGRNCNDTKHKLKILSSFEELLLMSQENNRDLSFNNNDLKNPLFNLINTKQSMNKQRPRTIDATKRELLLNDSFYINPPNNMPTNTVKSNKDYSTNIHVNKRKYNHSSPIMNFILTASMLNNENNLNKEKEKHIRSTDYINSKAQKMISLLFNNSKNNDIDIDTDQRAYYRMQKMKQSEKNKLRKNEGLDPNYNPSINDKIVNTLSQIKNEIYNNKDQPETNHNKSRFIKIEDKKGDAIPSFSLQTIQGKGSIDDNYQMTQTLQMKPKHNQVSRTTLAHSSSQCAALSITDQFMATNNIMLSPNSIKTITKNNRQKQESTYHMDKLKQELKELNSLDKNPKNHKVKVKKSKETKPVHLPIMPPNIIGVFDYRYF